MSSPNQNQVALWNASSGPVWAELQSMLDAMMAPLAARVIDAASPGAGARVLDVGCGAGATTLAVAERLGESGAAMGVDIAAPLLALAKSRAASRNVSNVSFVEADAQTYAFEPQSFDAVMSRFGVMFFDEPEAAFANLRRAARPGAKLAFVAWRGPEDNPFFTTAARVAAPIVPVRAAMPDTPGQWGFADGDRVRRILGASGWADVDVRPIEEPCTVAESDLFVYLTKLGPVGAALREAGDEATRTRVLEALRPAFAPFVHEGVARFSAACWLVTARA